MKKIFEKIHLWLSVPFGLIITLICFSGAMLVFEDEVNELFRHELYYVETVGEVPLPIEQLLEKVTATLPDSVSVTSVSISSDSERAYQVTSGRATMPPPVRARRRRPQAAKRHPMAHLLPGPAWNKP